MPHPMLRLLATLTVLVAVSVAVPAAAVEMRTHTASELGFKASSHLILGETEAVLVDAQLTRTDSRELVRLVATSQRRLTTIFVTSARPEHYLGLGILKASFPDARIIARPEIAEKIRAEAAAAIEHWRLIYVSDLPKEVVVPEPFEGASLPFEDTEIQLFDAADELSAEPLPTVLYLPEEATVFLSDLGFGGVHPWMVARPAAWRRILGEIRDLGPIEWVYPGRGTPGGAKLLDTMGDYLDRLAAVLREDPSPRQAAQALDAAYPDLAMPILLERSLKARRRDRLESLTTE